MYKINFWFLKFKVLFIAYSKQILNNPWKIVETVYLPTNPNIGFNTLRWIIDGQYEKGEIEIVKQYLDKDDVILEIGTGLGFISAFCAKQIGSKNIFTFEANPLNIEIAKKVFKKNNVQPTLQNAMLNLGNGFTEFPIDAKSRLASTIYGLNKHTVQVQNLALNAIINKLKPNFLIMDIEGAEYEIFSIIDFQTITKIQFELHPTILGNTKCDEIFLILKNNDFKKGSNSLDGRNFYYYKN